MPIRVLHIIESLELGGAQVAVKNLVENTNKQQTETFVYPLRSKNILIPIDNAIKLPYSNYDPRKFLAILNLCRKYRIDIIHAHLNKSILGALLATFFCDVGVVIHEHGPIFRKGIENSVYRFLLRRLHHRATAVVANSQATAEALVKKAKINPRRIRVVYNAVDFNKFDVRRSSVDHIRQLIQAAKDDIIIGFVGRLNHVTGPDILVRTMALLLEESARYLLVFVGDGPQYRYLQILAGRLGISKRIRFLGFRENVAEIMSVFDIGVAPSRQESFGITVLEFMRAKIPIVCSAVEGMAELVTNEVTALVPDENTPQKICRCVRRLATDKTLQHLLTDNAYRYSEQFSVQNCVRDMQKIYIEIVNAKKIHVM
jgi:glycosyltransferase involved in cell wall biosynthesis